MKIAVSTGNSRMEKKWNLKEMEISEFRDRISQTIRTSETMEQYRKMSKAQQDDVKDVGGYVLGRLKGGRRKKDCVLSRSALTLDMDYAHADVADQIEMFQTFGCFIYSTHKHTKEKPRLRLIIPLLREVTPDEYMAVSRKVAEEIGMELFDDTTYEPSRLMYWPSTSADGDFFFHEITGEPLNPDEVLAKYNDWKDVSTWPVSNRQHSIVQKDIKKQEDPLQKRGVLGAFNRTFTITQAIDTFISDVYQPSSMPGRYDYVPADSSAGVVIYEDVFAYSHHATDPACGKLMNAFDVVRIHKFGHLDAKASEDTDSTKLPSYKAMQEFASQNEQVRITLGKEREASARMDFAEEDWKKQLEYNRQGILINNLKNLLLILNNDENLKGIWKKNALVLGRSPYQWQHEPCLFGWKKGGKHQWFSDRKQTTIWEYDRPKASKDHPTMKPIALMSYPIQNSSMMGCVVLDPFLGSGSTLLACEQTGRICYGIELDEKFVDVIVKRYMEQKGSGDDVYVIRDGKKLRYSELELPESCE